MIAEDLARFDVAVAEAAPSDLPAILGALARLQALALARLTAPTPVAEPASKDRLLTPEQAAELAGVTRTRILAWAHGARWAVRPSRKCLRISEPAFRRWLASRPA